VFVHTVTVIFGVTGAVQIVVLALTATILMVAAISFPFLELDAAGKHSATSVVGAIAAFSHSLSVPMALAVAAFIVVLPVMRLLAILWALGPLAFGGKPLRSARPMFALAEMLRPWSMAEIFIIGVAVALVKVAGLATLTLGPAFWAFVALVLVTILNDTLMCRYSIWEMLDQHRA